MRFPNISCLVLLFSIQILPQQFTPGSPEWLVDMFFAKSSFPDKANYFSGEMLEESDKPTIGEELNGKGEASFHQIKAKVDKIVFAVDVKQDQKVIDFYCYLVMQENSWKISAIRRFLLPDFIYTVRDSLSGISSLSSNDSSFYLSIQLFTMTDSDLKSYLKSNLKKFQELVNYFNNNLGDKVDKSLASIGCNAIYSDKNFQGCIFLLINSFQNIGAGFIYAGESAELPEISVNDLIYLEEIIPGWFVFRTM